MLIRAMPSVTHRVSKGLLLFTVLPSCNYGHLAFVVYDLNRPAFLPLSHEETAVGKNCCYKKMPRLVSACATSRDGYVKCGCGYHFSE
jgi:hypothetical protein